jgi:hypothetical protein
MRVCVIDGQGGGLGRRLVQGLQPVVGRTHELVGLGTNAAAAAAMSQAGAQRTGVGARAIAETIGTADVILTSLNTLFPDAGQHEVTPEIVRTILDARGTKILLPVNRFRLEVAGTESSKLEQLIAHSLGRVRALLGGGSLP